MLTDNLPLADLSIAIGLLCLLPFVWLAFLVLLRTLYRASSRSALTLETVTPQRRMQPALAINSDPIPAVVHQAPVVKVEGLIYNFRWMLHD